MGRAADAYSVWAFFVSPPVHNANRKKDSHAGTEKLPPDPGAYRRIRPARRRPRPRRGAHRGHPPGGRELRGRARPRHGGQNRSARPLRPAHPPALPLGQPDGEPAQGFRHLLLRHLRIRQYLSEARLHHRARHGQQQPLRHRRAQRGAEGPDHRPAHLQRGADDLPQGRGQRRLQPHVQRGGRARGGHRRGARGDRARVRLRQIHGVGCLPQRGQRAGQPDHDGGGAAHGGRHRGGPRQIRGRPLPRNRGHQNEHPRGRAHD